MEKILTVLLEEFRSSLPHIKNSVKREVQIPDIPDMINVAIGVRRSGKTYLLCQKALQLMEEGVSIDQILFLNFEDDRLLPMDQKGLSTLIETFYTLYPENHDRTTYLFLDEIQNVENWLLVIRRFFDKKRVKIFLTGSSAKLLSKEIATSLRGRSFATEVFPYSFSEFEKAQKIPSLSSSLIGKKTLDHFYQHFISYFSIGGFPAVQHLHEDERRVILQGYVDAVLYRDIVERYNIENRTLIKYLIKSLLHNVATPFRITKFYNDMKSQGVKVGKDTIHQYMEYIEDAYFAFTVPLFSESIRKRQVNPKKIYLVDNGLIRANRLGISLQLGSLFENFLYLDLRRKGKKVFYYVTKEGYEIDFVIQNPDGSYELLQAVWDASDKKTLQREKRALEKAEKEIGIKGRILTAQDYLYEYLTDKSSKR